MKSGIIVKEFEMPFDAVCLALTRKIKSEGFLLLHQINTQDIVSKHGIAIRPLKQFLFFHPTYIKQIVQQDPLAINEIPVKIVVYDQGNGSICVSFPNPVTNLKEYDLDPKIAAELLSKTMAVLDI